MTATTNENNKKAQVVLPMPDNIHFKTRRVTGDKERHFRTDGVIVTC